ncbi:MAG: radical SAM protein [Candidatus Diapherotrites archaeon]|nr:radical SAM protein [Candidatus Diapherotrites archaeon]
MFLEYAPIFVGSACNNNCLDCPFHGTERSFRPFEEIKKDIDAVKAKNIVISGGEPTIHPDFFKIIDYANSKGFKRIKLRTNARMFAYKEFLWKAIHKGVEMFDVRLLSNKEKTHNFLSQADSFRQTMRGLENLKEIPNAKTNPKAPLPLLEFKAAVQVTMPIFKENSSQALSVANFATRFMPTYLLFDFGKASFDFTKNLGFLFQALDKSTDNGFWAMSAGIPVCLLGGFEEQASELYEKTPAGCFLEKCGVCAFKPHCTGIRQGHSEYLKKHIAPLKPEGKASRLLDMMDGFE